MAERTLFSGGDGSGVTAAGCGILARPVGSQVSGAGVVISVGDVVGAVVELSGVVEGGNDVDDGRGGGCLGGQGRRGGGALSATPSSDNRTKNCIVDTNEDQLLRMKKRIRKCMRDLLLSTGELRGQLAWISILYTF